MLKNRQMTAVRKNWLFLCFFVVINIIPASGSFSHSTGAFPSFTGHIEVDENPSEPAIMYESFMFQFKFHYENVPADYKVQLQLMFLEDPENQSDGIVYDMYADKKSGYYGDKKISDSVEVKGEISFRTHYGINHVQIDAYIYKPGYSALVDTKTVKFDVIRRPELEILEIRYPQPPETVSTVEEVPVFVKIHYDYAIKDSRIRAKITEKGTRELVGEWESPPVWRSETLEARVDLRPDKLGEWELTLEVSLDRAKYLYEDITLDVVGGIVPTVNIIEFNKIGPNDAIALYESTPFDVKIEHINLPENTRLQACVFDRDGGHYLNFMDSLKLAGTGEFRFKPFTFTGIYEGEWRLAIHICKNYEFANPMAEANFKIKVGIGGDTKPPQARITKIRRPRDEIAVGETVPIVVEIQYRNLRQGAKLRAVVRDRDRERNLGYAESVPLGTKGSFTFSPIDIRARRAGTWNLRVVVRLPNRKLVQGSFAIEVVE